MSTSEGFLKFIDFEQHSITYNFVPFSVDFGFPCVFLVVERGGFRMKGFFFKHDVYKRGQLEHLSILYSSLIGFCSN